MCELRQIGACCFVLLAMLLLPSRCFAEDAEKGLVGYWKFDEGKGTVCKDSSGKGNHAKVFGNPRWVDGFSGHALQFHRAEDYVDCGNRGTLDIRKAVTVELQLKILSIPQTGEPVVIGKGVNSGYCLTYCKDSVGPTGSRLYFYIGGENVATLMELKKWQHVVATYDGKDMSLYLDGKLAGNRHAKARTIPPAGPVVMGKGGLNAAIDEVRIWNRALSAEEALRRYRLAKGMPVADIRKRESKPEESMKRIDKGAPPMPWRDSKEGITDEVLAPWTPIRVERRGGNGIQIEMWGRTYYFEGFPFPVQITTKDRKILTEPIRVYARADGQELAWRSALLKVEEQTSAKVLFAYDASSTDGSVELSGRTLVEYDGMMRIDWKVRAKRPMTLEALTFEILIPAEHATYFNWAYNSVTRARTQPQFGYLPVQGFLKGYVPFLWIGDDERGLNWMCESDKTWFNKEPHRAIQVVKLGDTVLVRIQLVSQPVLLQPDGKEGPSALDYTFGLEATPAKPWVRDAWDVRLASSPCYGRDYAVLRETIGGKPVLDRLAELGVRTLVLWNWTDVLCHTAPIGHESDLRDTVKSCHERGMKVIVYLGSQMSESAPEWPHVGGKIRVIPQNRGQDRYPGMTPQFVNMVCNRSAYQNFLVHGVARLMDEYDLDGVYLDGVAGAWYCANQKHGCGYLNPDGSMGKTFPLFATRNTIRRIYTVIKSRKPDGVVFMHTSSQMLAPVAAWADIVWDGEQFGEGKAFPLEVLPLDAFRAELMGRQLGVPADFIFYCTFRPADPKDGDGWVRAFRKAYSLTLLHDVLATATGMVDPGVAFRMIELESSLWGLAGEFGRKEAQWLPYWKNSEYVSVQPASAYGSLYRHHKNGVLAVVSNLGRESADVQVRLDLAKLGLNPDATARDALSEDVMPMRDGRIDMVLPSLGWKVIWLR